MFNEAVVNIFASTANMAMIAFALTLGILLIKKML